MKTRNIINALAVLILPFAAATSVQAQGTVTFNSPWIINGIGYAGLYYDSSGMSFETSNPGQLGSSMAQIGVGLARHPNDGTPHLEPRSGLAPGYVIFSLTNAASQGHWFANGAPFGLTSVDLADPVAPSLSPMSITFDGFKTDGSMVSQTFTTPGNGATTFQTYSFGPDFAFGLMRVQIPSAAWAVDNIAWVPEPATGSMLVIGLLSLVVRRMRNGT